MKHYFTLLRHELWKLLINPSTYIAAFLFLLIMGFLFQEILDRYTNDPQDDDPSVTFFRMFLLPVFFMVPLLTMRSVAEERNSGTIETLMTTPITVTEMILAKFSAGYVYYLSLWIGTASFHLMFFLFAQGESKFDPYPIIGGYAFIAISGTLYLSLGIFASSLTRSQLIAGIVSFTLVFVFVVVGDSLTGAALLWSQEPNWINDVGGYLNTMDQMGDFSSGIIDTRAIIFHLSCCVAFLILSILVIEYQEGAS